MARKKGMPLLAFLLCFVAAASLGACRVEQPTVVVTEPQHALRGEVTDIAPDGQTIRIDHEDIEDVMPAMEMQFDVEHPAVVEGIQVGDQVAGHVAVRNGNYIITELQRM